LIVKEEHIGKQHLFSSEKLSPVLAIFRYSGFDTALDMVKAIYDVGGKAFLRHLFILMPITFTGSLW
jgi:sulfoacetaldehyde dehydrogenase